MNKVFFTKETLPEEFQNADLNAESFEFSFSNIDDPFFVTKGKTIVDLAYKDEKGRRITGNITAPFDGVVSRKHLFLYGVGTRSSRRIKEGDLFYLFYDEDEYVQTLKTSYSIKEDEITGEKRINWSKINGESYYSSENSDLNGCYYPLLDYKALICFNLFSSWPVLVLRCRKDICRIRKKDVVHFIFDEKTVLSYTVAEAVKTSDLWVEISFKLSRGDLDTMKSKSFLKIRIDSTKDILSTEITNRTKRLTDSIAQCSFKQYVHAFENALLECDFHWPDNTGRKHSDSDTLISSSEPCYVYLMHDTAKGFHKIGISNNPEYREHTLQSEKPTIELLASKAFPSRLIAEAIESALHKAFGEKRLRGEWFKLDEQDVIDLKLTLK